jgi:hypothetical protein
MKYIFKKGFTLEISNENGGIVLSVDKKDFYYLSKNKVFKLMKGKWELVNTKKINLKVSVKNKGIADLLEVASRYNHGMKFEIDEEYVLQALIFDLLFEPEKIKEWLPQGEEYIFEDDRLYVLKDGWLYGYDLPRALGEEVLSPLL